MKTEITLDTEQRLYVLPCAGGHTCLGFDVCDTRGKRLAAELSEAWEVETGTLAAIHRLRELQEVARQRNAATGWRSASELHPALVGLEGRRVVCEMHGERVRFQVGKSTGWIPAHLQIHNRRSSVGLAISATQELSNLRIIR